MGVVEYHSIKIQTQDRALRGSTAFFKRKPTLIKMKISGNNLGFCVLTEQDPAFSVALGVFRTALHYLSFFS